MRFIKLVFSMYFLSCSAENLVLASTIEEKPFLQLRTYHVEKDRSFWRSISRIFENKESNLESDWLIRVLDPQGEPLSGAKVLVGSRRGDPFPENSGETNEKGEIGFTHEALRTGSPFSVTIQMAGYSSITLFENHDNFIEARLQRINLPSDYSFLRGGIHGFPSGIGRSDLEIGLFLPAFRPESLMNFDPNNFVSSFKDEIDLFGKRKVPGNVVLPSQRKSFGLIPIRVSKPFFTMPLPNGTHSYMGTAAGSVRISSALVDAIQIEDYLKVVNMMSFSHVGWTNDRLRVTADASFDLPLREELEKGVMRVNLRNIRAGSDAITLSLIDLAGDKGDFLPLDVKAAKSEEMQDGVASLGLGLLKKRKTEDQFYVFTGLFNRNLIGENTLPWIVGSLQRVGSSSDSVNLEAFLEPMERIAVSEDLRSYRFTSPSNGKAGLVPDLMILNIVSVKKNRLTQGNMRQVLWSAFFRGSVDTMMLPDLAKPVLPSPDLESEESFEWEVIAVKSNQEAAKGRGLNIQSVLRNLQHVSTLTQKF